MARLLIDVDERLLAKLEHLGSSSGRRNEFISSALEKAFDEVEKSDARTREAYPESQMTAAPSWVEEIVEVYPGRGEEVGEQAFELVTFGRGGNFSPYDVDKTSALLELDDLERFGRQES